MEGGFSRKSKEVISESRLIAIELGYDYISTLHLFLADCRLNDAYSIRKFAFNSEDDFQAFTKKQRVGEPSILVDDLRLTNEAEITIRKAYKLWSHSIYIDAEVQPYHLFLAASLVHNSEFNLIFQGTRDVHEKLEQYYVNIGQVDTNKINKSLWMRISRRLLS